MEVDCAPREKAQQLLRINFDQGATSQSCRPTLLSQFLALYFLIFVSQATFQWSGIPKAEVEQLLEQEVYSVYQIQHYIFFFSTGGCF